MKIDIHVSLIWSKRTLAMAKSLQDRRGMKNSPGHTGQSYILKPDQHITGQQCMPTPSVFEPDNWVTRVVTYSDFCTSVTITLVWPEPMKEEMAKESQSLIIASLDFNPMLKNSLQLQCLA
jgi:hypothetical protein